MKEHMSCRYNTYEILSAENSKQVRFGAYNEMRCGMRYIEMK